MTRVIIIGARGKRDCCMCRVLSRSDGRIITGWGGAAVVCYRAIEKQKPPFLADTFWQESRPSV